jgi:hypothetical protein
MGFITKENLLGNKKIRDLVLIVFKLIEDIFKCKILGVLKIYKTYKIMIKLSIIKLINSIKIFIKNKIGSQIYKSSRISQ